MRIYCEIEACFEPTVFLASDELSLAAQSRMCDLAWLETSKYCPAA
jgi:hypothetical protein